MLILRQSAAATSRVDFSPFLNEPAVVLAVSGGSDSTALMVLAQEAFVTSGCPCGPVAVTVDHGLRPEAADEAQQVGLLAKKLGIEHRILTWQGEKPARGVQAAARDARLGLLAQAAKDAGARVVLTGHTADDQAETVLMRAARGEGIGLAGIAPATLYRNEIWFARPLLSHRRNDLRAVLAEKGIGWSDDPSNENAAFERVRVRKRLADPVEGAALFASATTQAKKATAERRELSRVAAELIDRFARIENGAAIACDAALIEADDAAAMHALRLLIATAADAKHLPDVERTTVLLQGLRAGRGSSLANARIARTTSGLMISRDRRGHSGPPTGLMSPFSELLPSFDLAAAGAIARLLGNTPPTVTPWT